MYSGYLKQINQYLDSLNESKTPTIVFLGCSATKADKKCKAKDLYQGSLFKYSYEYAKKKLKPDRIFILSAKHHLLSLGDLIAPYDMCLDDFSAEENQEWANEVIKELKSKGISKNCKAIFLCGDNYRKNLQDYFKAYRVPTEGLGIGEQLAFYIKKLGYKLEEDLLESYIP